MSMRHQARAFVALAAAYAVALQAILLAIGGPVADAREFAVLPICSSLGAGHSAPVGHAGGCLGTCLGCCCGTPVYPAPGPAMTYAPMPAQTIVVAFIATPLLLVSATGANRCRAPPLA